MDNIQQLKQITKLSGGYSKLNWVDGKKAYYPALDEGTPRPITDDVIRAHLDGSQPIGIKMNTGDGKSHFAVFDFDDHDGSVAPQVMRTRVGFVAGVLHRHGTPHFVVRSGGGRGYHIWIVFERASRADYVRKRMREILNEANTALAQSPWDHEKFVPDDGKGKGMFHSTDTIHARSPRPDQPDSYKVEHYVELLPKDGEWPVIALPLALESVAMTPTGWSDAGYIEFEKGGDLVVQKAKPSRTGPKAGQTKKEIDVDAAVAAFAKARPGGDYHQWVSAGFNILAAFGQEGVAQFIAYSQATEGFESDNDAREKWNDLSKRKPTCKAATFWAYARAGGYQGGLPDDVKLNGSDVGREILTDVIENVDLFRDKDGTAYGGISPRRAVPIDSVVFADWLRRKAYEAGQVVSAETVTSVQSLARAHSSDVREVHLRVARIGETVYVDLCDVEDNVAKITSEGASLVGDDEWCPTFRRSKQMPLSADLTGTIDDVRSMINLDDDQFVLFMACAVKMYFPDSPSPIVNLIGEYGSGKTSATIVMRTLIDPVPAMVAYGETSKPDDLLIRCWHNGVLTLENMSNLTKISDLLCGVCTGMGFEVRQLFSNGDLFTLWVRRPVIVNGIDPTKYASDLISRMIEIELQRPEKRIRETQFERDLVNKAPLMVGAMFNLVGDVLRTLPEIDDVPDDLRMAEFATVGEAVARLMGKEPGWFVDRMMDMQEEAQDEAADDSATMQALSEVCQGIARGRFWGSPQELLTQMQLAAEGNSGIRVSGLPMTASTLSRELGSLKGVLRRRGWGIEKKSRKWLIVPPKDVSAEELVRMMADH